MLRSDRVFGLVVVLAALAYVAGAFQIQTSFLADPVGPRTFPILVGLTGGLCGLYMVLKPDAEPHWPGTRTLAAMALAAIVLVAYALSLPRLGFLVPTAVAAGILSYQIEPRPFMAVLTGLGLAVGLYVLFRYALGLGLVAFAW